MPSDTKNDLIDELVSFADRKHLSISRSSRSTLIYLIQCLHALGASGAALQRARAHGKRHYLKTIGKSRCFKNGKDRSLLEIARRIGRTRGFVEKCRVALREEPSAQIEIVRTILLKMTE